MQMTGASHTQGSCYGQTLPSSGRKACEAQTPGSEWCYVGWGKGGFCAQTLTVLPI